MFNVRSIIAQLATALLLIGVGQVRAQVLYDSLDDVNYDYGPYSPLYVTSLANSFSTGASAVSLTDVKISLFDVLNGDGGSVSVQFLSDGSTSPGTVLKTLGSVNDSSLSDGWETPTVCDFPLGTPYPLSAGARYWIEVSSDNNSMASWDFSPEPFGVGVAGEFNYSQEFGLYLNGQYAGMGTNPPFLMEVTASAVPEPTSLGLLAAGGVALLCRHKRARIVAP